MNLSVMANELPEIACLFEVQENQHDDHHDSLHQKQQQPHLWRLWRFDKTVQIQQVNGPFGEVWEKLKKEQVAYTWLMHQKKFAIRYEPSDLKVINNQTNWKTKASLISPQLLSLLEKLPEQKVVLGKKTEHYKGRIGALDMEILWLPEYQVPAKIIQKQGDQVTVVSLKAVYLMQDAPWKPLDFDQYDDLDFADLGDNEAHPMARYYLKNMSLATIQYHKH